MVPAPPSVRLRRTAGLWNRILRVSLDANSAQADGSSFRPSIAADGTKVAFESLANLVAADLGDLSDIFLRDRRANSTRELSVTVPNLGGSDFSATPLIPADGRIVVFFSPAANLVRGDTNQVSDVFAATP